MENYYLIGILGSSMSSLAAFLKNAGNNVRGYDVRADLLQKDIDNELNFANIDWADIVVYSSAFGENFSLIKYAKTLNKKVIMRGQLLAQIASLYEKTIAIAGSHGKSSVTAMIYNILKVAGKRPSLHVGAPLIELGCGYDIAGEEYFITEACEYHDNFLFLKPYLSIVTNVESEHLDYFGSFSREKKSFEKFISQSENSITCHGLKATNIRVEKSGKLSFKVENIKICLNVGGIFNVENALFAISACRKLGISDCYIKLGLESFRGLEKRFESVGSKLPCPVILDYAHHPQEIEKTYASVKKLSARKVALFQMHTYSRTQNLMNEFVESLSKFDEVLLFKTYPAREEERKDIEDEFAKRLSAHTECKRFDDVEQLKNYLFSSLVKEDILLILGAGDLPEKLMSKSIIWRKS